MTAATLHTARERHILAELGINPRQPGLDVSFSRDDFWLDERTPDGDVADFVIEWSILTVDALEDEPTRSDDYRYGTFADLPKILAHVLELPNRCPDSQIELTISEWATHYRTLPAAA